MLIVLWDLKITYRATKHVKNWAIELFNSQTWNVMIRNKMSL